MGEAATRRSCRTVFGCDVVYNFCAHHETVGGIGFISPHSHATQPYL